MNLAIITPFKNEEKSIERTLQAICKQDLSPTIWILIDDSSTDSSPIIVKKYERDYPFILYHLRKAPQTNRATGSNIVDIFNLGLEVLREKAVDWDIVLKLDADLVMDRSDYLSFIVKKFSDNPSLGIASGSTYVIKDGSRVIESKHKWHTQGPNKFYRRSCLESINGLKPFKGWDGLDDIFARNNDFLTEKFFEQQVLHLYPTQTRLAEGGIEKGLKREATSYRNMGYPIYMPFLKSLKIGKSRSLKEAYLFLSYSLKAYINSNPLISKEEEAIVKRFMWERLFNRFQYTSKL